ncbi:MAG: peptidylprolyl isomerase [Ignavibacteriae bacterium]|nr:peptidylprolyl isomerase [Ignavibacteriota bacterium]
MLKNFLFISVIILMFFWNCTSNNQETVLAEFENGNVIQSEYIDHYLLSTKFKPEKLPTKENLEEIVVNKALEKISVQEAIFRNIEKDSIYINIIRNNERRLLYQHFIQKEISPKIISDSLINKFYTEFTPQYRMRYIMRPFLETSDKNFHNLQQNEINKAYGLLNIGKSFEEVVQQYSQDISTNKKGGDLGWIIRESIGDDSIRKVMDTLQQFNFSKPFKGYGGYYILYKGDKRDVEVPAFDEAKQKIWQSLYHSRKVFIQNKIDEKVKDLELKYYFKIFSERFDRILSSKENSNNVEINFDQILEKEQNLVLAEYLDGVIYLKDIFSDRKKSPTNKEEFYNRFESIKEQHLISKFAKEIEFDEDEEISSQINKMKSSLLSSLLYQKEVKDKVNSEMQNVSNLSSLEKVKYRSEKEKSLRSEFEKYLKEKYKFKFVDSNFESALKRATELKAEQNLKK